MAIPKIKKLFLSDVIKKFFESRKYKKGLFFNIECKFKLKSFALNSRYILLIMAKSIRMATYIINFTLYIFIFQGIKLRHFSSFFLIIIFYAYLEANESNSNFCISLTH